MLTLSRKVDECKPLAGGARRHRVGVHVEPRRHAPRLRVQRQDRHRLEPQHRQQAGHAGGPRRQRVRLRVAGGLLRTLNRHLIDEASSRACRSIYPEGKSYSDIGRVIVLNDPAAWSPDGMRLATASRDRTARVYDIFSRRQVGTD